MKPLPKRLIINVTEDLVQQGWHLIYELAWDDPARQPVSLVCPVALAVKTKLPERNLLYVHPHETGVEIASGVGAWYRHSKALTKQIDRFDGDGIHRPTKAWFKPGRYTMVLI